MTTEDFTKRMTNIPFAWSSVGKAAIILLVCGGVALVVGLLYASGAADSSAQDIQPVSFSHKFHAGQLEISCLFCHRYAHVSSVAGVPSMQLCMGCHQNLGEETPETKKLLGYWENGTPIQWIRLQRLPDFVYFTHEMHLHHGVDCVHCHGRVEEMPHTPRASSFEMGWCLSCHRQQGGSLDCLTCHK